MKLGSFRIFSRSFYNSTKSTKPNSTYDCVIVGSGHNGLIAASYLAAQGKSVCVLERRHVIGGAAVTEEIIPGFKFSRASYLLSLLRPQIIRELELEKHGLKVYIRDPNSYTPLLEPINGVKSLILGRDSTQNQTEIGKFSRKDAEQFEVYETKLQKIADALEPLLDNPPFNIHRFFTSKSSRLRYKELKKAKPLYRLVKGLGVDVVDFYELLTAPTTKILDRWFESEPLKATLATDSVIGANLSPRSPGSGYVLLHHVMGEVNGVKGAWGYVEGGMGNVSAAIAKSAVSKGAVIFTDAAVKAIEVEANSSAEGQQVKGVQLENGQFISAKVVLSNATPHVTFRKLLRPDSLPAAFKAGLEGIDYDSPVTKINLAVSRLPQFTAEADKDPQDTRHLRGTIHLNTDNMQMIEDAYQAGTKGFYHSKPVIEMTIPSVIDPTVSPKGAHVVQLFTQYTPYKLYGHAWTDKDKANYLNTVLNSIEAYAPGFRSSVIGHDVLTPQDLEATIGLTGGNIFHGAMSLDQLYFMRPLPANCDYRSPVRGLYLCGSGAHPGGGVLGSPGRLSALTVLEDRKLLGL